MTGPRHGTRDLPGRGILLAIVGVFALIALAGIAAAGLLHGIETRTRPPSLAAFPPQHRAGPPLEVDQAAERLALEARARESLASYGWTDRNAGIAHIPVDRAMTILAERGWPDPVEPGP